MCGIWKVETAIEVDAGVTFALLNHEDGTNNISILVSIILHCTLLRHTLQLFAVKPCLITVEDRTVCPRLRLHCQASDKTVANHNLARRMIRAVMERLRFVCNTEHRKVLVSIDRLDLCKVGVIVWQNTHGSITHAVPMLSRSPCLCHNVSCLFPPPQPCACLVALVHRWCIFLPLVPPCRCVVVLIKNRGSLSSYLLLRASWRSILIFGERL